eukprot:jgi/Botrbrau1/5031/Bobra.0396s0044.1
MAMAENLTFQLVVAATRNFGIGRGKALPWRLPKDMAFFKDLTLRTKDPAKRNVVIMGRTTWESIPKTFRPLSGRVNVVLSRSAVSDENSSPAVNGQRQNVHVTTTDGVHFCSSLEAALAFLGEPSMKAGIEHIFVIGGGKVYREALKSSNCVAIHLTEIEQDVECDTFFPSLDPKQWQRWSSTVPQWDNGFRHSFLCYTPASLRGLPDLPPALPSKHEEYQYLDLVDDVIRTGCRREDRTGTGTFSKFGCQMRFNLRHSFPLLTTKRVFWRGVAEELLWFIGGETNARKLSDKGVKIWDGNGSREYLDRIGLTDREEMDLGPVYGFQWRHFGAKYSDMQRRLQVGKGVDQVAASLNRQIKKDSGGAPATSSHALEPL